VALIGCGNIGSKRIRAILRDPRSRLDAVVESHPARRERVAAEFAVPILTEHRRVLDDAQVEAVVVSTPPEQAQGIVAQALEAGKHVLCEKPLGRSLAEAHRLTALAQSSRRVLKCGFNLRHDIGLNLAAHWVSMGRIGRPYFFACAYVNGCTLVNTNGVGALLDMGTHCIDLARWFMGEIRSVQGRLQRYEFAVEGADDNGFVIGDAQRGPLQLHFSLVRWHNAFTLEVSGSEGAVEVRNLPKWGEQEIVYYQRVRPSGLPPAERAVYCRDETWEREWLEFRRRVEEHDLRGNHDGLRAMAVAEAARESATRAGGEVVAVPPDPVVETVEAT
jgi:predicted dehydrogenase